MSDPIADIFGIPQDKAAALRLLTRREPEIVRNMHRVGDVVDVPVYMERGHVRIAMYEGHATDCVLWEAISR